VCKLGFTSLLLHLVWAYCFTSSVVTPRGYKSRRSPLCTPTSSCTIYRSLLTSFLMCEKKEREREKKKEEGKEKERGDSWNSESIASPSPSSHGGTRLDHLQDHAGSHAEPHESVVYNGGGGRSMPCARGSSVPYACKRIHGDLCSFL
jgi:hypothetical protein